METFYAVIWKVLQDNVIKSTCLCRGRGRCGFSPWVWKIPCSRKRQLTPVLLPGESHGQRSLAGYSPWGCKKLDTTEYSLIHLINPIMWPHFDDASLVLLLYFLTVFGIPSCSHAHHLISLFILSKLLLASPHY